MTKGIRFARTHPWLQTMLLASLLCSSNSAFSQETFYATADTYSKNKYPNDNYGDRVDFRAQQWSQIRGFVRFDLSSFSDTSASSAFLELYVAESGSATTIDIHKLTEDWDEYTLTANNQPAYDSIVAASFPVSSADETTTLSVDITGLFNQLLVDPASDFGFVLRTDFGKLIMDARETGNGLRIVAAPAGGASNTAPIVDAGSDFTVTVGMPEPLSGFVSDDGLPNPPASTTITWSKISGPGAVTFVDAADPETDVSMDTAGTYVLRLAADDSGLQTTDDVIVTAIEPPAEVTLATTGDSFTKAGEPDRNFGGDDWVRIQQWSQIKGWYDFDFSSLPQGFVATEAQFKFRAQSVGQIGTITIHKALASWNELSITHNTMPSFGLEAASFEIAASDIGNIVQVDITALFNELASDPASAHGFVLKTDGANLWTDSREFGTAPFIIATPAAVNTAPQANAGADQNITLPASANLSGSVTDDGLPNPPGTTTVVWDAVVSPGTVTFGDASNLTTTASFDTTGTYVLRLTADDGQYTHSDTSTIIVSDAPPVNQAPTVSAGSDFSVSVLTTAPLSGTASDDGLPNPPGNITNAWSVDSGPGTVVFADSSAATSDVHFSSPGTYVLRLTSDDGELQTSNTVTVTVTAAAAPPPVPASSTGTPLPNPSAVAGNTTGESTVSITGESVYSIPIFAPPGINGLNPDLSLIYSHRQDESITGVGWTISGLSAIRRCAGTVAQDGASRAIDLSLNDRFCLDDNKLRLVSGSYGAGGSEYRTERDTVAKIVANGTAGNGPESFTVHKKDGLVYEYGATADSRIESLATGYETTPHTWALSKIRDRSGNEIQFSYEEDGAPQGAFRLDEVKYRANPTVGVAAGYSINLVYETQPSGDVDTRYLSGGQVVDTKRLTRIDVLYLDASPGSIVRRYELTYEANLSSASRSRLQKVAECAGFPLKCLAPVTFEYRDGSNGWDSEVTSSNIPTGTSPMLIDMNGDGYTDLVYPSSSGSGSWMYRLANSSGGYSAAVNSGITNTGHAQAIAIDYDTDGLDDILVPYSGNTWWAILGSGTGLQAPIDTGASVSTTAGNAVAFDENGDGLDDLITFGTSVEVRHRIEGAGFSPTGETILVPGGPIAAGWSAFSEQFTRSSDVYFDANGDGMQDVVVQIRELLYPYYTNEYRYSTYALLGGGVNEYLMNQIRDVSPDVLPLDINGDGYHDAVYQVDTAPLVYEFSTGNNFGGGFNGPALTKLEMNKAVVTDWDGDGFEDVVLPNSSTGTWFYIRSLGESLATPVNTGQSTGDPISTFPVDVNGDGLIDLGYVRADNQFVYRPRSGNKADLLTKVTDGNGNEVRFSYVPITQGAYTKGTGATLPNVDYIGPVYVVDQVTRHTGVDNSVYAVDYDYQGLRWSTDGRALLGFQKRTMTDGRNGLKTTETYHQDFPYQGLLSQREVELADATRIRYESYTWDKHDNGSGYETFSLPYLKQSLIEEFEAGGTYNGVKKTSVATTNTVDQYGTVTSSTTTTTEPTAANGVHPGSTITETITRTGITNDTANWCVGRPSQTQANFSHSLAYGATITRTMSHSWNYSLCRLDSETVEPASGTYSVTRGLAYDSFGNVSLEALTGAGMATRYTLTYWGATGNRPINITNPLGEVMSFGWDTATGRPTTKTDPNGLVQSVQYDVFGRPSRAIREDGSYVDIVTSPCTASDNYCSTGDTRVVTMVRQESRGPGANFIRYDDTFLDRFDRPVRAHSPTMTGAVSMTQTRYNATGRVVEMSMPTLNPTASHVTTISYDAISRPISISRPVSAANPSTQLTTVFYQGLATRIVDPEGFESTKITDPTGRVVRSVDDAGYYQDFEYDAFGNLRRVADSFSNTLYEQMLAYGVDAFRTSSTDMDMGSWTYTPNALGEVESWTDAKGQSFSASYDMLSRKVSQTESEGTKIWSWGTSAAQNNIGRLASVSSSGFLETYSYDSSGRLVLQTTTTDDTYEAEYGYAPTTGLLDSLTYPESTPGERLKLKYEYQNGITKRVSDFDVPAAVFWEASDTDARGNVVDETLGGTLQTIRGYDPVTGWLDYIETGQGGGFDRQNLEYRWNRVGSLTQRKDVNKSLTEDFFYDNVHRFASSRLNGSLNLDVDYDQLGNITYKDDVGTGTWTYHASKKHAVIDASGITYAYDENGNVISRNGQTITWTSGNLPKVINSASGSHEFFYDANGNRYKQIYDGSATETTIFVGDLLEKRSVGGTAEYRYHVKVNGVPVAVVSRSTGGPNSQAFILRDHLGSVEQFANVAGGTIVSESFSAFGERRDPGDWSGPPGAADLSTIAGVTPRGYTYHTNLEGDSLIHMNGRVADAHTGRFLSADPFVPDPNRTQAFNRYSYVYNDPLSYTDPSGFFALGGGELITIGVFGTVGSFIKGLFGDDDEPVKGCFVAATACYGQGGMTRVPGFGGVVSQNWNSQPDWMLSAAPGINGDIPTPEELRRENLRRLFTDIAIGIGNEFIWEAVTIARDTGRATIDGRFGDAALGAGLLACEVGKLCKAVEKLGVFSWAKQIFRRNGPDVPISGKSQVTRKAGVETTHGSTSQRIASEQAQRADAQSVHMNQTVGTITEGRITSRIRPDVATVRTDGKIDAFEVLSPGQTVEQQTRKLQKALGDRAGEIKCVGCD